MEYKTVIEIVSEADSSAEAIDIAGDYLKGEIASGVRMRYKTIPLKKYLITRAILVGLLIMASFGFLALKSNKESPISSFSEEHAAAIQSPLKTHRTSEQITADLQEKNQR